MIWEYTSKHTNEGANMSRIHDKRFTLDQMNALLRDLDEKLEDRDYAGTVKIRAIGGYAMLEHGFRPDDPTTPDLDTQTPAFDQEVMAAIREVAEENDISDHWLNNDTVLATDDVANEEDVEVADAMSHASFAPKDLGLKHIAMEVATPEMLMRTKAMAACDVYSERGDKDLDDCISILEANGATDERSAKKAFPFLKAPEFNQLFRLIDIAKNVSLEMRPAALQAHRDMIKTAGLDIPEDFDTELSDDWGEIDDWAYQDSFDDPYASGFDDDWY